MYDYFTALLAEQRLAEIREFAAREALARAGRPPRRPLRIVLGTALVRAGHWMLRQAPEWAEPRNPA